MRKKLAFIIALVVSVVVSLAIGACSYTGEMQENTFSKAEYEGLERVYFDDVIEVAYYYDKVTDVMYMHYYDTYNSGLTVMLDPVTGGPLTYTAYHKYLETAK